MSEPMTALPERPAPNKRRMPVFGILSCAVVLTIPILYLLALILGFPAGSNVPEQEFGPSLAAANLVFHFFLATIGSAILAVLGLIFGIIGILQKDRKRIFAILGTVISSLLLAGFLFVLILIRM